MVINKFRVILFEILGRQFNFECAWQIIILVSFQESATLIYDSYVKSIKHQSRQVSPHRLNLI